LRLGRRRGDNAEVAQVELVGSEYNPAADAGDDKAAAAAAPKGVRGRLRAAAERVRGKKEPAEKAVEPKAAKKPAAKKARKTKDGE